MTDPAGTGLPPSSGPHLRWLSTSLLIVLLICFGFQYLVTVYYGKPYDAYLALTGYGIKSWMLWQLFTYQFFHAGWIHLVVNLVALWFFARATEGQLGPIRFLGIYLGGVLVGGILQGVISAAGFWLPESMESVAALLRDRFGGPLMGASVGLWACLGALCRLNPEAKPLAPILPFRAAQWRWIILAIATVLVFVPTAPNLPHIAHLGAFVFGLFGPLSRKPGNNLR